MSENNVDDVPTSASNDEPSNDEIDGPQRSTIRFPYGDLEGAEQIVLSMHENRGREAETASVAADLSTTVTNGTFRTKLAAAVTFGLLQTQRGQGRISLTALGQRMADPITRSAARVEAFLRVPLYARVYKEYQGQRLPGDAGLESTMIRLGVSAKQASRARQAMTRSAETAGFYNSGRDRLVEPPVARLNGSNRVEDQGERREPERDTNNVEPPIMEHPLIQGLLQVLPAPGEPLSAERRKKWMSTLETSLEFIYPEPTPTMREQPSVQSESVPQQ